MNSLSKNREWGPLPSLVLQNFAVTSLITHQRGAHLSPSPSLAVAGPYCRRLPFRLEFKNNKAKPRSNPNPTRGSLVFSPPKPPHSNLASFHAVIFFNPLRTRTRHGSQLPTPTAERAIPHPGPQVSGTSWSERAAGGREPRGSPGCGARRFDRSKGVANQTPRGSIPSPRAPRHRNVSYFYTASPTGRPEEIARPTCPWA